MSDLYEYFERFYLQLRINYYRRIANVVGTNKGSLSATECFCLEIILLMRQPSISEFADFLGISLSNANYRINSLIEKGYLKKTISPKDRRESLLEVTDKYRDFYGLRNPGVFHIIQTVEDNLSPEELKQLISILDRINRLIDE